MLDMTGRCVMGWLIVFLLLSIILYNLSKDYRKLAINGRLEILEASNETSKVTPLYLRQGRREPERAPGYNLRAGPLRYF